MALVKVENDGAYSNLALNSFFTEREVTPQEKRLATAIFYGVLDRKITLDYVLSSFIKTKLTKTAPFTLAVLRSALYQIMYMDSIPDSAAVNEAVKLIKKSKESHSSGFVNAVLRNVLRTKIELPKGNSAEDLSVLYSCPKHIVESFVCDYGVDKAIELLKESLKPSPLTIRVNTVKTNIERVIEDFKNEGISCQKGEIDGSLIIEKGFAIQSSKGYKNGDFHVQDLASQKAVSVLDVKSGERVLDICAAPGGKSFTMAEIMQNNGEIISCDLYSHRVKLIENGAKRLGIDIIKAIVCDAAVFNEDLGEFDCILCDVPCSGLGVIRRKPEIKYKDTGEFEDITHIQFKILSNAIKYLKPNGRILYSTCTLRKAENENLVKRLEDEAVGIHKVYEHTFMPHIDNTDGFYCALLCKAE